MGFCVSASSTISRLSGTKAGGRRVLESMSNETGGTFLEVSKKQTVDRIFDTLQEQLRNQYNLGYVPDRALTTSEFRTIELKVKRKDLIVEARHRYWAER